MSGSDSEGTGPTEGVVRAAVDVVRPPAVVDEAVVDVEPVATNVVVDVATANSESVVEVRVSAVVAADTEIGTTFAPVVVVTVNLVASAPHAASTTVTAAAVTPRCFVRVRQRRVLTHVCVPTPASLSHVLDPTRTRAVRYYVSSQC